MILFPYVFDECSGRGFVLGEECGTTLPTIAVAAPTNCKWTILVLKLPHILSHYLQSFAECEYGYVKSIQLCADMNVKGVFLSNVLFTPNTLPPNMTLPLTKGMSFYDLYEFVVVPPLAASDSHSAHTPSMPCGVSQGHSVADQLSASVPSERSLPSKYRSISASISVKDVNTHSSQVCFFSLSLNCNPLMSGYYNSIQKVPF